MNSYQEPKYKIEVPGDGTLTNRGPKLVNRQSGKAIPDDEPILVLRAQDCYAASVLEDYARKLPAGMHKEAVSTRAAQFRNWAEAHPTRMKEPTTQIDEHWTTAGEVIFPKK